MKKYLITGFSGFVSKYFLEYIEQKKIQASVLGIDLQAPDFAAKNFRHAKWSFEKLDLLRQDGVANLIHRFQPDYILHLASFSSVAFSWKEPIRSFQNNTNIFLNLLETVRNLNLKIRILSVGSSEEYGNVDEKDLPLKESHHLKPVSPYAVARAAQEMLSGIYADGYGLDIVMTRSFNHIGPGQKDIFAVSSFARQLVEAKKRGPSACELTTGDISIVRDFVDVRDVVRAYYDLFQKGRKGEVYNVCSGTGRSLKDVILKMAEILGVKVVTKTDPQLIRPSDNKMIIGSNEKIRAEIGWNPKISLEKSLKDVIRYYEK